MSLLDLITGNTGNQIAEEAENKFGIKKNQVIALLAVATPLIVSYLYKKSKDTKEANALSTALEEDHDGSILNNPSLIKNKEAEGNSILGHVFGDQKASVENQLSQSTGISLEKIGPILAMLAPVVMGYIGQQKQQTNTNTGGLGDLLGNILNKVNPSTSTGSNPLQDILGQVLGNGSSNSGSNPIQDVLGNILGGTKNDKEGGLGSILGNIFKGK